MLACRSVVTLFALLAMLPACRSNPLYCEDHPGHNCLNPIDASNDGRVRCMTNDQCVAPAAVCDTGGSMTCVQCTTSQSAACTGTTPVCGTDNTCQSCTAHAQCATSNACLPDGSCADDKDVAYVSATGMGTACTNAAPCKRVLDALNTGLPYVKFQGAGAINEQVSLNNRDVTILADPGAVLTDTSNGILLKIDGTSHVAIYDLEISGASGVNNPGISLQAGNQATVSLTRVKVNNNPGGGIAMSAGSLTVIQSTFSGNQGPGVSTTGGSLIVTQSTFSDNHDGGILQRNGQFIIVGNVFFNNGDIQSSVGGIAVDATTGMSSRLEFNTFSQNETLDTVGPGIQCLGNTFTARNNILSDNRTPTAMNQTGGTCAHDHSITHPGAVPSGNNSGLDPLLVNPPAGDLHIQATSPARGAADPNADLTGIASHDIDGTARQAPADVGAYQFK